jgi:hypothetical protein
VPYFVGLDVSLDETAICVIDDTGDILKEGRAETDPEAIVVWLNTVDGPIERLGLEAGPLSPWLYEWLYWWLWRLDDQWEKFGPGCERQISMLPTDYFRRQCYVALDVDEEPAVDVVNKLGAEYFVVSSDYPHSDGAFPEAIQQFLGLPLSDEQRRRSCGTIAPVYTQSKPRRCPWPKNRAKSQPLNRWHLVYPSARQVSVLRAVRRQGF